MKTKAGHQRQRAPGAGRKPGSFCFVAATVEQLKALNPNGDFKWLVSKKQVEALGGNNLLTANVGELKDTISGQSVESAPKIVETEF